MRKRTGRGPRSKTSAVRAEAIRDRMTCLGESYTQAWQAVDAAIVAHTRTLVAALIR